MTHREIEEKEIIERYVLHQLSSDERRAFQEHYFTCDECFERAQTEAQFIASAREASTTGALAPANEVGKTAASFWGGGWWRPVLALSVTASLVLAAVVIWLWLSRTRLQTQLESERQARQTSAAGARQSIDNTQNEIEEKLRQSETERAKLQQRLDELERSQPARPNQDLIALARIPSVTLESSRDSSGIARLSVPARARKVLLLIPVEPGNRFASFTAEVITKSKVLIDSIIGVRPNRSGSLAVSVPAARLGSGDYRVKLYGVNQGQRELLAEYDLRVTKQ